MALLESMDSPLSTGPLLDSDSTQIPQHLAGPILAKLADANKRIAALESELDSKREALTQLLAEDLRMSEDLAELQKFIWGYHRGLPGGCDCAVCAEVKQSHREARNIAAMTSQ